MPRTPPTFRPTRRTRSPRSRERRSRAPWSIRRSAPARCSSWRARFVRGTVQALEILVSWAVTTTLLFVIVLTDERRMTEERLEQAWPIASRNLFLVWLGVLALPFHFARTRGRFFTLSVRNHLGWWLGFAMGLLGAVVVTAIDVAVMTAFAYAFGLPIDD